MAIANPRIYNYDPKTDGWKKFPGAETKTIKIDQKMRGIREFEIPYTHYCKAGKTLCGLNEETGATFYNDPRNTCDGCKEGLRQQTKQAMQALADARSGAISEAKAEEINVIDYKAAEANDHPEVIVSH